MSAVGPPAPDAPEARALAERAERADAFLAPVLRRLVDRVRDEADRVAASAKRRHRPGDEDTDTEAIHDFRVALRRLRTVLRPARGILGKRRAAEIAEGLRRFADATGALRDEEVLRETLGALALEGRAKAELGPWLAQRAKQERARRRMVAATIAPPAHPPLAHEHALVAVLSRLAVLVDQRLALPRARCPSAGRLATKAVTQAAADVAGRLDEAPSDASAMHALRIRYKRLRYSSELFAPLLGEHARAVAKEAARMQKHLGELHDLDEALRRLRRARSLPDRTRAAVLRALVRARAAKAAEVGEALAVERAHLAASDGGG